MSPRARRYVIGVIATGGAVLAWAMYGWNMAVTRSSMAYFAAVLLASAVKVRLPGIQGTYSLNAILAVIGIATRAFPETVVAVCGGAVVQSLWRAKRRPALIQVLFNIANLAVSLAICYLATQVLAGPGQVTFPPAVLAFAAALYFVTNTLLTSVVLAMVDGKPLLDVCGKWYLWPVSYFLAGTAVVGLLPLRGQSFDAVSWVPVIALLYLLHFFHGLSLNPHNGSGEHKSATALPIRAAVYVGVIVTLGTALLAAAGISWHSQDPLRFTGYLIATGLLSTCKVRLPRMTSTISVSFVPLIAANAELPFPEIAVLSAVAAVVQSVWNAKTRPRAVQIGFNAACLVVSSACAYGVGRLVLPQHWGTLASLAPVALVLYATNTALVAGVLCLIEARPLTTIWENCSFWTFPYYLVGAAAAGVMVTASRAAGWQESFFILPAMLLVYISYRLHVRQAVQPT